MIRMIRGDADFTGDNGAASQPRCSVDDHQRDRIGDDARASLMMHGPPTEGVVGLLIEVRGNQYGNDN
jgi:hypothetical protein